MKTKEELNALKEEVETVSRKLAELTDEELEQVAGGNGEDQAYTCDKCGKQFPTSNKLLMHITLAHFNAVP